MLQIFIGKQIPIQTSFFYCLKKLTRQKCFEYLIRRMSCKTDFFPRGESVFSHTDE